MFKILDRLPLLLISRLIALRTEIVGMKPSVLIKFLQLKNNLGQRLRKIEGKFTLLTTNLIIKLDKNK